MLCTFRISSMRSLRMYLPFSQKRTVIYNNHQYVSFWEVQEVRISHKNVKYYNCYMKETELKWNTIQGPPLYEDEKEIVLLSLVESSL
jgi:hypothetical protein